jgi:hypothetical protein
MEENFNLTCAFSEVLQPKVARRSAFDRFQRPVTQKRILDEKLHRSFDDVAREIEFRV